MANKQHIFTGVVPPASAPLEVGHHYVDTAAKITYISVGTASAGDWTQIGGGGGGTWGSITGTLSDQTDLQTALNAKQATITGTAGRPIYKNGSSNVVSLEEVQIGFANGWEQLDLTRNMNGVSGNFDIYRSNLQINALQNSVDEGWNVYSNQISVDTILSGFNMGTNSTAFRFHVNNIVHAGTSDIGAIEFIQNNFSLGNGTDPIDVRGFAYMMGFGQFNANCNVTGPIQGYGFQPYTNAAATISSATYVQGFYDAANINCVSPNYSSFNASPTILSIANNNNYNAFAINPNITSCIGNAGVNGIALGGNWGTFGTNGGFNGITINPNSAANASYANGIAVYMDNVAMYPGTASSLVIQDLTITFSTPGDNNSYQVAYVDDTTAGSETAGLSGNLVTVHMESGVSTALQIKAAIEANITIAGALTVTVSGVGSNAQNAQVATNFAGGSWPGTKRAAYLDGDVEITGGLTFGGALSIGKLNAFGTQALADGGGTPSSIHSLITQPTVAANVTLTSADTISVNTAALITIGDNAVVGTTFIGVAALGLPAVLSMGSGATLDRCYGALFALSLDASATGGTVDEVGLCKSLAIPNGVTTVNNLYGYLFDLPYGDPGTKTFGFYDRPGKNNYFAGNLLIGGTPGSDDTVTNSSIALEIKSTTKAFMNARMTTTERNALTAVNGMQIYNTTTDKLQVYAAGSWVDLH